MPFRLAASEIAQIRASLLSTAAKHGPDILGAELGQVVKRAVAPKTIKSLGGLKSLVGSELSGIVAYVDSLISDTLYRVIVSDQGSVYTSHSLALEFDAGVWDGFSNPNVNNFVGFDTKSSRIIVAAPSESYGPEVKPLKKMTADEYRLLAQEYANEQGNQELKAELLEVIQLPAFYPKWFAALQRYRRIASVNYPKTWEIKRTGLVMSRLQQELEHAGLNADRAFALANEVCSRSSRNSYKATPLYAPVWQTKPPIDNAGPLASASKDLHDLRELMHRAIDQMSLDDLKEIRVPAGLLLEAFQKSAD
jgi:hypothetical protein